MDTKLFSCLDQRKCGTAEKVFFLYRGDFLTAKVAVQQSTMSVCLSVCLFVCHKSWNKVECFKQNGYNWYINIAWVDNLLYILLCLSVCLFVCLSVCLSAPRNLRGLKSYDHEIWHVGPLSDRKPLRSIRILIFGRKPVLWAQTPFFGFFGLFKD